VELRRQINPYGRTVEPARSLGLLIHALLDRNTRSSTHTHVAAHQAQVRRLLHHPHQPLISFTCLPSRYSPRHGTASPSDDIRTATMMKHQTKRLAHKPRGRYMQHPCDALRFACYLLVIPRHAWTERHVALFDAETVLRFFLESDIIITL
jgi:hypothetical protein